MNRKKQKYKEPDLLDIVFENRNKEYGAYELRRSYPKRLKHSLYLMLGLVLLVFLVIYWPTKDFLPPPPPLRVKVVHLQEYQMPTRPVPKMPDVVERKKAPEIQVQTKHITAPVVVPDEQFIKVTEDKLRIKPLKVIPSFIETEGPVADMPAMPKVEKGIQSMPALRKEEDLFEKKFSMKVQRIPQYPGGNKAWTKFLSDNLSMGVPLQNGAMPGTYTVLVAFLVHPDSTLSDFRILKDPGYGTGDEVLRVLQKSGHWIPGRKNNRPVMFAQIQTVIFKVDEQ